jgi:hypothetical protein
MRLSGGLLALGLIGLVVGGERACAAATARRAGEPRGGGGAGLPRCGAVGERVGQDRRCVAARVHDAVQRRAHRRHARRLGHADWRADADLPAQRGALPAGEARACAQSAGGAAAAPRRARCGGALRVGRAVLGGRRPARDYATGAGLRPRAGRAGAGGRQADCGAANQPAGHHPARAAGQPALCAGAGRVAADFRGRPSAGLPSRSAGDGAQHPGKRHALRRNRVREAGGRRQLDAGNPQLHRARA